MYVTFHRERKRQKILCFSFHRDHWSFPVLFAQAQETSAEGTRRWEVIARKEKTKRAKREGGGGGEKTQRGRAVKGARTVASRH